MVSQMLMNSLHDMVLMTRRLEITTQSMAYGVAPLGDSPVSYTTVTYGDNCLRPA